jgi:cytochrome b pre-mRNA-processing protein 3
MSLLARLLGRKPDPREALRPLWQNVIALAREPGWYAKGGVADTVAGRFDMIALITALVLLRMDGDPALRGPSARLTELFVQDMDGQLRQSGVGDLVVGKRMGKLMGALGGRIEALRGALASRDDAALRAAIERNVTLIEGADPAAVAAEVRVVAAQLAALDNTALLAAEIER